MPKVKVANKADVSQPGCKVYQVEDHTLALFRTDQGLFQPLPASGFFPGAGPRTKPSRLL